MEPELLEQVPEEIRDNVVFKNIKDFGDLATQFANGQSRLGNSIRIPGDEATKEDRQEFYGKLKERVPALMPTPNSEDQASMDAVFTMLGRPATESEYEFPEIEGVVVGEERQKAYKSAAHKAGLSGAQLKAIIQPILEIDRTFADTEKERYEAGVAELRGEWGSMFEVRINNVKRMANLLKAPESLQGALDGNTLPAPMVKFLHETFKKFSSESDVLKDLENNSPLMDPGEAATQAQELRNKMSSPEAPATGSAEYKRLVNRLVDLEKLANPGASTDTKDLGQGVRIT